MRRTLVLALALGTTAAGLVPAVAGSGQPVDAGQAAGVTVTGLGPAGHPLLIGITGFDLNAGPRLVLTVQRCAQDASCDAETYVSPLGQADFTVDANASTATLRTTLSGQPLVISWQPSAEPAPGFEIGATQLEVWGGGDSTGVSWFGRGADATVRYAGATCTAEGGVGAGTVADTEPVDGNPTAPPVSDLHLQPGSTLRC